MTDTTRAERLLNEMNRSPDRSSLPTSSLPPPPASGMLPFSLPSSFPPKQSPSSTKSAVANVEPVNKPGALAGAKAKWLVVKDKCSNVLKTQGIAAVVVFVIVAGIMAAVNPPICQTKAKSPDEKPKRSVVKILVWALLAGALAMVIPLGIEYAKKKKKNAGNSAVATGSTVTVS